MFSFCSVLSCFGDVLKPLTGIKRKALETKQASPQSVIVLRTHDVVNADLARSWCDEHGLLLQLADQRDELFPAEAGALVIDLDHLALRLSDRLSFVQRLCRALPPYPVATASYDLDSATIGSLRSRGVLVFRRIERQLFYELAAAVECDVKD